MRKMNKYQSAFDRSHMRKPRETQPDDLQFSYLAGIVVSSIFPPTQSMQSICSCI